MYTSYGRGKGESDFQRDKQFYVNNCGMMKKLPFRVYSNRPNGRNDYQVIYVTDGCIEIETKNGWKKVIKGDLVFFEPKTPQHYYAVPNVNTTYCWMHFTGYDAERIVKKLNLKTGVYQVGKFDDFVTRCIEIINTMKKRDEILEYKISSLAIANLVDVYEKLIPRKRKKFEDVVLLMENDKPNGTKIDEYAKMCNFSRVHFSRLFKEEYGMSPTNYRLKLLVDKSKPLLIDSGLKISEVAVMCGFDDQFYYSRVFKRFTGMSPENYKKMHS
ncbi:MAG: AraC family transcriptional regulator [Ruminococcaceae bacterium]|nr:AraC family transcriptional regulator [Oscillospiraceae bacterium]